MLTLSKRGRKPFVSEDRFLAAVQGASTIDEVLARLPEISGMDNARKYVSLRLAALRRKGTSLPRMAGHGRGRPALIGEDAVLQACADCNTLDEVAHRLGTTRQYVYTRVHALAKTGKISL